MRGSALHSIVSSSVWTELPHWINAQNFTATVLGGLAVAALKNPFLRLIKGRKARKAGRPGNTVVLDCFTGLKYWFSKKDIQRGIAAWDHKEDPKKQDPRDPITVNSALELQSQIQGYIEYLLNAVEGADRVLIHKFHNGGKYHTGVSTQKMKLVYEACRHRGFKVDNEMSGADFVLEKMGGILKKVVDNRYLHLTIKEDKDKYCFTPYFQLLQEDGVEANHLSILRSNGQWRNIGLLSIHFIKSKKETLTEKEMMIIAKARRDISLLLVGDIKGYPKNHI